MEPLSSCRMGHFTVALHQFAPVLGDKAANLKTFAKQVKAAKADLHVFPELALTGYFNRDLLRTLAEPLDGPSVREVKALARRSGAHLLFGMPRESEVRGVVHNSAVLVTPEGEVSAYDKIYLPSFSVFQEDIYFGEGHALPVAKTRLGKIGMCICYDLFFPEVTKSLAMKGADVIACISASPNISRRYFEAVIPARAVETTSWLLFCNVAGMQDQLDFWGGSRVYGPLGDEKVKAPLFEAATVTAEVGSDEVAMARGRRPLLRDTRRELLAMTGDELVRKDVPPELAGLRALQGHLGPYAVVGLRMGRLARKHFRERGPAGRDLDARVCAPMKPPVRWVLDGVQFASQCTLGKGNITPVDASDVSAVFESGGKRLTVQLRDDVRRRIDSDMARDKELEQSLWIYTMPEEELFDVSG